MGNILNYKQFNETFKETNESSSDYQNEVIQRITKLSDQEYNDILSSDVYNSAYDKFIDGEFKGQEYNSHIAALVDFYKDKDGIN